MEDLDYRTIIIRALSRRKNKGQQRQEKRSEAKSRMKWWKEWKTWDLSCLNVLLTPKIPTYLFCPHSKGIQRHLLLCNYLLGERQIPMNGHRHHQAIFGRFFMKRASGAARRFPKRRGGFHLDRPLFTSQ